jgi:hypothetical protein
MNLYFRKLIYTSLILSFLLGTSFATLSTANPKSSIYGNPGADGTTIRMNTYNFITLNLANPNVWQGDQTGTITANIITSNTVDGTTLTVSGGKASLNINHANSWTAQQTGDITADCLTTGTVDGTTLTLSGCAAGINLANANVWTGAQEFDGAAYGVYVPGAFIAYPSTGDVNTANNYLDEGNGAESMTGTYTSYDGATTAGLAPLLLLHMHTRQEKHQVLRRLLYSHPVLQDMYQLNMYIVCTTAGTGIVYGEMLWTDVSGVRQNAYQALVHQMSKEHHKT